MNSADLGINFITKTDYVSSEIGLFNGEGYKGNQGLNSGLSTEWRLTAHLLGNGEKVGKYKRSEDTYANISFAGLLNKDKNDVAITGYDKRYDRDGFILHAVYNQPEFLIAASYSDTKDKYTYGGTPTFNEMEYKTFSVNGEYRPIKDWTLIGRYDKLTTSYSGGSATGLNSADAYNANHVGDASMGIYGVAYDMNKNVRFIANGKTVKSKDSTIVAAATGLSATSGIAASNLFDKQSWMLTAEVNW
jgi:predicted porin